MNNKLILPQENCEAIHCSYPFLVNHLFSNPDIGLAWIDATGRILRQNTFFSARIVDEWFGGNLFLFSSFITSAASGRVSLNHSTALDIIDIVQHPVPENAVKIIIALTTRSENTQSVSTTPSFDVAVPPVADTFEFKIDTSPDGNILQVNDHFAQVFGIVKKEQITGKALSIFFCKGSVYDALLQRLHAQHFLLKEEAILQGRSGIQYTVVINCRPILQHGGQYILRWTMLDISDRVVAEERLRKQTEELDRVNARMERFLYRSSHDLRSPVASILGLTNLLKIETKDSAVLGYIDKIEFSAYKLDSILSDLRSFSKVSYQRAVYQKVSVKEMLEQISDACRQKGSKEIALQTVITEGPSFYSDYEKLYIVLEKLIDNAFTFYDKNKSKSFIRIIATVSAEDLRIEVFDNGIGIAKTHIGNIFNLFYKATYESRGAGLGLYIVKETLQQLKGTITVESELGFGSVFCASIPNHSKGKLINRKLELSRVKTPFIEGKA